MGRELQRVRQAAARWREAGAALTERDAAILAAYRAGATYQDIADAAGISYQRVAQIVRNAL